MEERETFQRGVDFSGQGWCQDQNLEGQIVVDFSKRMEMAVVRERREEHVVIKA